MNPGVPRQHAAVLVDDRALTGDGGRVLGHERRVVVAGNEADLMAIRLVRDGQTTEPCVLADVVLRAIADREHGPRELGLRQREQEI